MKSLIVLLVSLFFINIPAWADSAGELQTLEDFFSLPGIENLSTRLTGAALEQFSRKPMAGEYLPVKATKNFRLLVENETSAIYEATISQDGIARSWSAFFQRGLFGSKLDAINSLNIPPYLAEVEYKNLLAQTRRSATQEARLIQLQRLFMTTEAFKKYFNDHRADYDLIARFIESGQSEEAENAAREAALVGVRLYGGIMSDGEIIILFGTVDGKKIDKTSLLGSELRVSAFFDSVLGLLHLPAGASPPAMSPQNYIFVEALAENWYLFRNLAAEPWKEKGKE